MVLPYIMTASQIVTKKVQITHSDGVKTASGEIQIQYWNKKERTLRALKFGGMCWGGAVVAVFMPLVHFVLVPCLIIAGPIMFFFVADRESVVLGGVGVCPGCSAALPIARAAVKFPLSDLCTSCQSTVKIDL